MIVMQPGRIEPVVLGGRTEIPHIGIAVAGEEAIARELVARPFADHRRGDVADIVLVEGQDRTEVRPGQGLARPAEAVVVQAAEIDPLLEIDGHLAKRHDRPCPIMMRIDVFRPNDDGFALHLIHCFQNLSSY